MIGEVIRRGSVCAIENAGGRWLHTGWNGGRYDRSRAYSVSVGADWNPNDIGHDIARRLESEGFDRPGPTLITGVEATHARIAAADSITVFATAGLSNPATLPVPGQPESGKVPSADPGHPGTVNVAVWTDRALAAGARANAIAMVAEAKAATLLETVGVPGTSTDAVLVGDRNGGEPVTYCGSGTEIGHSIRVCVRDAILASVRSRYGEIDRDIVSDPVSAPLTAAPVDEIATDIRSP